MGNQTKVNLSDDTIVLVIDLFRDDSQPFSADNKSNSIIKFIEQPQVKGALIGTYDSKKFLASEKWLNLRKKYETDPKVFGPLNYKDDPKFNWDPCPMILDWDPPEDKIVSMGFNLQDVHSLIRFIPTVKNLIVSGQSWEMCIRNRRYGLLHLIPFLKEKNINIIVNFDWIALMKWGDAEEFVLENEPGIWEHIKDTFYFLPEKHYDRYLAKYIHMYEDKYPWS